MVFPMPASDRRVARHLGMAAVRAAPPLQSSSRAVTALEAVCLRGSGIAPVLRLCPALGLEEVRSWLSVQPRQEGDGVFMTLSHDGTFSMV